MRPCGFPRDRCQDASNSVSTTDVSRHEHPSKHNLRRLAAERRGKTRRRSPSRSSSDGRFRLFAEEDAGPPCGHPASDSRALDGALPASGRIDCHHHAGARGGEERCGLVGRAAAPSVRDPLTPLLRATCCGAAGAARCLPLELVSAGGTSMPPASSSPRCLPPEKTTRALLREPDVERCLVGQRGQPPHAFIDVREHRLDL